MKVKIDIDCDDLFEVIQHLECLKEQIKKKNKVKKYIDLRHKIPPSGMVTILKDANCYGEHKAKFTNEDFK